MGGEGLLAPLMSGEEEQAPFSCSLLEVGREAPDKGGGQNPASLNQVFIVCAVIQFLETKFGLSYLATLLHSCVNEKSGALPSSAVHTWGECS